MKIKNKFFMISLLIIITLGAVHQILFSRIHVSKVGELASAMRAKEFCSCYFVFKKSKEYCLKSVAKGLPMFEHAIDEQNKSVEFINPMGKSKAFYENERFGCSLTL